MLAADAWLDSAIYDFWQTVGRWYTAVEDFFSRFRVSGIKRFFIEIFSDGLSFARHRHGADDGAGAARLRRHRLGPVQQGRGHLGHLPRSLRQRGWPPRHPLRRFLSARQAARLFRQGDARHRGPALLRPFRRRCRRHAARPVNNARRRQWHAGRLVDHPAARQEPVPQFRAHHRAQDQGSLPRRLARVALHQGRDPQALFRPRLYGRRQFRRRRGVRVLLRQEDHRRQSGRGRDARRPVQGADQVRAACRSRGGARPRQSGAVQPRRCRLPHRGPGGRGAPQPGDAGRSLGRGQFAELLPRLRLRGDQEAHCRQRHDVEQLRCAHHHRSGAAVLCRGRHHLGGARTG